MTIKNFRARYFHGVRYLPWAAANSMAAAKGYVKDLKKINPGRKFEITPVTEAQKSVFKARGTTVAKYLIYIQEWAIRKKV